MSRFVALVLVLLASRVAAASTHDAAEAGFVKRVVDAINTPETARGGALASDVAGLPERVQGGDVVLRSAAGRQGARTADVHVANGGGARRAADVLRPGRLPCAAEPPAPHHLRGAAEREHDADRADRTRRRAMVRHRVLPQARNTGADRRGSRRRAAGRRRAGPGVQTLITGMPPALEQQVLDLVKQGQKIAAIRHYEREAGVDLTTAKDVVDRLIEPGR